MEAKGRMQETSLRSIYNNDERVEAMTTTMTEMIMTMSLMTALTALYPRVLQMSHCYGVMTLTMMMKN